jgi:autotransporter-associated beta strand protein
MASAVHITAARLAAWVGGMVVSAVLAAPAFAADGTWNVNNSGNWSATGNWSGGTVANGVDSTAFLSNVITNNRTITLDSARTIGGIAAQDTSDNYTISGANTLTLDVTTGIPTLNVVTAAQTLRIRSVIAGSDGLQKTGAGTLRLNAANTYTGGTTLTAGTLRVDDATGLGSTSATLTVNSGTVDLRTSVTVGNLTGTGGTIQRSRGGGAVILTIGNGNAGGGNFQGVIADGTATTALTKTGTGTITLSGANTYTGTTTISGGTLQIGNGSTTGSLATTSTITNNATLAFNRTNTITQGTDFASVIAGTGGVTKLGSGTLIFSGANTYTGTTLISGGTLQIGNGSTTGSLATTSTITNNATLAFNRTNTITQGTDFASVIAGTGGVTKLGANTLILNGTNTYSGATLVSAGTLRAGAAAGGQAFGNLSAVTMADVAGAALDLNGFSQTIGSLAGGGTTGGTVALGTGATLTFGGDNTSTEFGSTISGTGGITKVGTGTFAVTNTAIPSGITVTVSAGTFQLGNGGVGGALTSPSIVVNNATYAWNRSDNRAQGATSVINGTGVFLKLGAAMYTLGGTNSYSGGTTIQAGTLQINNASAIGSTSGTLTVNAGGLDLANFSITVGDLTGTGGSITNTVAGSRTLTVGQGNTGGGNYQGVIATGTGTIALTKVGTGTITLSGANTYTGLTTVSAGTLALSGSGSINASSGIDVGGGARLAVNSSTVLALAPTLNGAGVSSRAVLGGTGSLSAAITLDNVGDVLSPGNSPGILTFDTNQSWGSSSYDWELNDWVAQVAGTNIDQINVTGSLNLTGGSGSYILNVLSLTAGNVSGNVPNFAETNNTWTILATTSGITGFNAANWTINTSGFTNPNTGTWGLSLANSNRDFVLTYTAVPEPGTIMLLVCGGLAFLAISRRWPRTPVVGPDV